MELRDYIHFYIGCDVELLGHGGIKIMTELIAVGNSFAQLRHAAPDGRFIYNDVFNMDIIKLILRPLSTMTNEEMAEARAAGGEPNNMPWVNGALRTKYLLSKFFDLYGLVDAGVAIPRITITVNKTNMDDAGLYTN